MNATLRVLVFIGVFISCSALGQGVPLPTGMPSAIGPQGYAKKFYWGSTNPNDQIVCHVRYENSPNKEVSLTWSYYREGIDVQSGVVEDKHSVSFQPTAVCAKSGETDTLYVAGWLERSAVVVIEEWVFGIAAIAEAMAPSGEIIGSFARPPVSKNVIYQSAPGTLGPLLGMACNHALNTLVLLPFTNPPKSILEIPINGGDVHCGPWTGTPCLLASALDYPLIDECVSLQAHHHAEAGFVILAGKRFIGVKSPLMPASAEYHDRLVLRDPDGDGLFEAGDIYATPLPAFKADYPSLMWVGRY